MDSGSLPIARLIAGKYRLDRLIGKGGMGVVYAGRHELLDQAVAIKLLLGDAAGDPAAANRFLNEARAAARIPSDHVVRVIDVGLDGGHPYLVMEYLEGRDLAHVLGERGRLGESEAVDHVLEASEALAQAHALGIIHRDLKPSNLFLTERPDGGRVIKVLDFGIAKAFGSAVGTQAAVTTQGLIGSPAYMAPEYVRSAKSIDTRADIWAIGVILFELLSGEVPFTGDNPGEVLAAILEKVPPSLASRRADLSPGLVAVVARCLARKPEDRYQELADVAEALAPYASKRTASVARIRETVRTLRLRPPSPDASGPLSPRAGHEDLTALAPPPAAQQTNQSWSDGGPSALPSASPRPSRLARAMGIATGVGVVGGLIAVFAIGQTAPPEPPSVTGSASIAPAEIAPSAPVPPPLVTSVPAPAPPTTAAASIAIPRRRPVRAAPPAPRPAAPTLARDRR